MKQARLAAGWLKQKSKLLPVLFVIVLVGTLCAPAFIPRASATVVTDGPGSTEAMWADNYKTLDFSGDSYTPLKTAPKVFVNGGQSCADTITFATTNFSKETKASYQMWAPSSTNQTDAGNASGCMPTSDPSPITVNPKASNPDAQAVSASGSNQNVNQSDPCDASSNPLSWFVCPVIGLINEGVVQMQKVIDNLMQVNVGDVFNYHREPGKGYYAAWNTFRLFGVVLIVIAGLLMVISQALGWDVFDAYTVKKVLPRLFVAAIGISLSWWLMKYLAQLTNDLGVGIRSVIYYPFRTLGGSGLQSTGSYIYSLLIGAVTFLILGPGGILSLVVTAFLAALVAFLVLIIRQLVLIFLIVIAPIAIACYVLPNTEKVYKLWWDSLFKGMMMFPIITGFIALGRVFSVVASNSSSGAGASVNQVIALIAFFLPYFALPFTFRLAGGAMATIAGLTNDRSRGAFDRLKAYRSNKAATNMRKTANFSRFSENSALGRGVNTALGTAFNPMAAVHGKRGIQARRLAHQTMEGANFTKDNAVFQANQNDDQFLLAVANRDLAQQKLNAARVKLANATTDEDRLKAQQEIYARQKGIDAATQIPFNERNNRSTRSAALMALARTGYQFDDGEEGYKQLSSTVESIVGSDQGARAAYMDEAQFHLKNAGRYDLGGINHGAGYSYETGIGKSSGYTAGNAKKPTWTAGAEHFLGKGTGEGTPEDSAEQIITAVRLGKDNGGTDVNQVLKWHGMLVDGFQSPNQANKDEIARQMEAIQEFANRSGDENLQRRIAEEQLRARRGITPDLIENNN